MRTIKRLGTSGVVVAIILCAASERVANAETRTVGTGKTFAAPCAAFAAAVDGDRIEIDAGGTYSGDTCAISKNSLTIVGVGGGRAKIDAAGNNAQGKATWVVTGNDTTIENIELLGAAVPDENGAGIRQEGRNLTVRNCYFHDNQNGILAGDKADSTITVEHTEFANNGAGDGLTHNLYINHVAKLVFRFNYSHHAKVGHLLKSRALVNVVAYNRLTDEATSTSSYEVNLPSGGTSYLIGNVIEQGPQTQNSAIIDYASEPGTINPATDLYVVNNTVVNNRPNGGTFVQINAAVTTPAKIINNIFSGPGTITNQAAAVQTTNYNGDSPMFAAPTTFDFHILDGSPCKNAGTDPGMAGTQSLLPEFHYVHPASNSGRTSNGIIDIGAYEIGGDVPLQDGGAPLPDGGGTSSSSSSSSSSGNTSSSSGSTGGDGGGASSGGGGPVPPNDEDGCGCRATGASSSSYAALAAVILGAAGVVRRRSRMR